MKNIKEFDISPIKVVDDIYWVGAIDWDVRNFHGYSTERGTTYNAYLILDEQVTLIDTVKKSFTHEMLERIKKLVGFEKITNIIVNHTEPDHSGALVELLSLCPNATVYAIFPSGVKFLDLHYSLKNVKPLKLGEQLKIGKRTLKFFPTPMVHWPDNMVTYCEEEKILFSNDAFGQHLASEERFAKDFDLSITLNEARKYYANIVLPYSQQTSKALINLSGLNIEKILPSHGLMWTTNVDDIVNEYRSLVEGKLNEKAVIVFDTMWDSTDKLARVIDEYFKSKNIKTIVCNLQKVHISNIIPEIMDCKYLCVGSPTLNNGIMPNVAGFLSYVKGLITKANAKSFIAFGSFGWSGQSIDIIEKELSEMGLTKFKENIKVQYVPQEEYLLKLKEILN